ncbi:MAG: hypothetical protein H0T42_21370 [Deltaproteobacteria bacterium]|nr:hypothetical protein [Deltaproteobacteria bacterium]
MKNLIVIATALVSGCGDNLGGPDAGVTVDVAPPIDSSMPFTAPTPFAIALSATGPDQLTSAWPGPNGTFYAAGFAAATPTGDKLLTIVRLTATGTLDTTFATAGILTTTVKVVPGQSEVDVVTQSDGKIIVSTTTPAAVTNATDAADTDIALVRVLVGGTVDTSFGVAGVRVVSLNTSFLDATVTPAVVRGRDGIRGLAIGANNQIFVHAYQRGDGLITGGATPRIDTEWVIARFTADGTLDTAYGGGDGKFVYDIFVTSMHTNATPHAVLPLADGSVIAGGYANTPATNSVQPVLFKVNAAGTALDTTWATQGLFHESVLAGQTEIYNFARHGDQLVTGGYGRAAASPSINDYISLRFNMNTGVRDATWGGTSNGAVVFDPSGAMLGSNCRNAIALPDGKTALIGSTGPSNMATQDAVFAILDATGRLDTAFGTGIVKYQLGGNGNDQFWGGTVSGDTLLVVGYQGGGADPATMNDDSYGVLVPLP